MYRTHTCGCLRACNVNQTVTLAGWVQKVRNLGAMTFIDLRDRYGITQIVVEEHLPAEARETVCRVGREWVIQVVGKVVERQSKKPQNADGRHRGHGREGGHPARSRSAPLHHRRGLGRRRRPAHEVPLPRPAASAPATQHDSAPQDGPGDPPLPLRRGIPRDRNPPAWWVRRPKERATSSCRAACRPTSSTPCPNRRRRSSSC